MNSGQEIAGELVVSGRDAAEVLEPTKAALDDVSAFIGTLVEGMDDDAVGFVGDDGLGAATYDFAAKVVAVIALVGDEGAHGRSKREKGRCGGDICVLAGGEMKCAGSAVRITQCVDFRGASAA